MLIHDLKGVPAACKNNLIESKSGNIKSVQTSAFAPVNWSPRCWPSATSRWSSLAGSSSSSWRRTGSASTRSSPAAPTRSSRWAATAGSCSAASRSRAAVNVPVASWHRGGHRRATLLRRWRRQPWVIRLLPWTVKSRMVSRRRWKSWTLLNSCHFLPTFRIVHLAFFFSISATSMLRHPPIPYYWTVPLMLDRSYLVGNLTNSKIAETNALEPLKSWHLCISYLRTSFPNEIWVV